MGEFLAAAAIALVHVLGGGVWIGAMVFSVFVLHPRAEKFFARAGPDGREVASGEFEDFIFTVVHGARWKVVAGIAAIVASGALLLGRLGWAAGGPAWRALVVAKLVLLGVSLALFVHVSWALWPRRVFAGPDELPAVRRRFWWVGVVMIACNTTNLGLGVLAHLLRARAGA
ncbi:MAG: hypothetical protein JNL82_39490 [Myxococcales bacterium]|nr:hypothetical protein [Myxococcales bacterium]